ncbi:hypothetical protein EST38_g7613 [Candolleomyces aberdarensis]|uniref:SCP domain-containing protein n=1 Tax=Candolleomyces aberdarensis TaxID=2316362 RepID=A0A4Q2DHI9_9AGAR|nr:hypothetical protein EST38_g7613 [Candolleomyces aberdarensis]
MARFATILSVLVSAATLETALAGPACAYRYRGKPECVEKCRVVLPVANNNAKLIEEYIAVACGSSVSSIAAQTSAVSTSAAVTSTSVAPQTSSTTVPTTTSVQTSQTATVSSTTSVSSSSAANLAPTTQDAPADTTPTTTSSSSTRVVTTPPPATTSRVVTTAAPVTTPPRPTTTAAPPPTTPAPSNGGSTGSTSGGDIADYLAGHNTIRRNHGASDLTWSDELASAAQRWANNCQWKHSGGAVGPFGENLAAGTNLGIRAAIKLWTDEVSDYNPASPTFSHFTQVVWKGTTQVGCAVQTCTGILGNSPAKFYVCEYNPPGNVAGRFGENVQV